METIVNAPTGGMFTGGGGGEYPAVGSGTSMNTKASVAFEQQPHGPMMQPQHMNPQLQQMQYTQHQQHIIGQQPNVYQVVQYLIFQFFLFFFLFFDLMAGLFPFLHRLTCNIFYLGSIPCHRSECSYLLYQFTTHSCGRRVNR